MVTPFLTGASRAGERVPIEEAVRRAADIVPELLEQGAERAMQKLHTRD
jgi:hypothetical protein